MNLFPQSELDIIVQMINNSKNYGAILSDQAENVDHARSKLASNEDQRSSKAEDSFVYEEFLSEVDQLAMQMSVVALYSLCEKTLTRIVKQDYNVPSVQRPDAKELRRIFANNNAPIADLEHHEYFNEIRLVSNSIKHGGTVSRELSELNNERYRSGMIDLPIKVENRTLDLYYFRCRQFLHNLCARG